MSEPISPELAAAQSRARRVPAWIRVPLIVLALGGGAYQIVAEVGVAGWLMTAQAAALDGKHFGMVTGMLTLLITLLPTVIVIQLLAGLFPRD